MNYFVKAIQAMRGAGLRASNNAN